MDVSYKVELDSLQTILRKRGLDERGRIQKLCDSEVLRQCEPYTPRDTGALVNSATTATDIGSGEVIWNTPYARYQYYGVLMVSPSTGSSWAKAGERKVKTETSLTYHGGGMRGKLWFERWKADRGAELIRRLAAEAGGEAKT